MDRSVCMSLWCEEAEDQQIQDWDRIRGPARLRAPWDPSVSGRRVIQRLLQVEQRYLPSLLYVSLIQRHPERREELAKWALQVCCDCGCDESVFPLSISLLDRFLSASLSVPVSPCCLSAACVLIASKLTGSHTVSADALCSAAESSFLPSDLREMERLVLSTLRWDTAAVTPQDFLPHLLNSVVEEEEEEEQTSTLRRHSDTLAAMCACDSRFLGAPPSLVAAAALNCALQGLDWRGRARWALRTAALAQLCQTDQVVLQCYSEMIEEALRQRLGGGVQQKDEEVEDERPGTPIDMRHIDF
ncbi:unnamed protein product [Ophioblennius macclurei]